MVMPKNIATAWNGWEIAGVIVGAAVGVLLMWIVVDIIDNPYGKITYPDKPAVVEQGRRSGPGKLSPEGMKAKNQAIDEILAIKQIELQTAKEMFSDPNFRDPMRLKNGTNQGSQRAKEPTRRGNDECGRPRPGK